MPDKRAGGWQGIVGGHENLINRVGGGFEWVGRLENSLKFILLWFLSKLFLCSSVQNEYILKACVGWNFSLNVIAGGS